MPEMDTPVAVASWSVVVAARPAKPCVCTLRRGSKMRRDSVAMEMTETQRRWGQFKQYSDYFPIEPRLAHSDIENTLTIRCFRQPVSQDRSSTGVSCTWPILLR